MIFTMLHGQPMAQLAARHVLERHGDHLAETVLLLPTRRACNLMRLALIEAMGGKATLLPRILPIGDLESELPGLLPAAALSKLAAIPSAMPEYKRLSLLVRQIELFEKRKGNEATMQHSLRLARDLAQLHDQCTRYGVTLTMDALRGLLSEGDYAEHWQLSLNFLAIVAETWPLIEAEEGTITASARTMQLQTLLAETWERTPPQHAIAIGSTASQPMTARLLRAVAKSGEIILPGLDPKIAPNQWAAITPGHPLFHIKTFLDSLSIAPSEVQLLSQGEDNNVWLTALESAEQVPDWRKGKTPQSDHLRLISCAHPEEETRILALLVREAVEQGKRVALVTPDESLLERTAAHLARYNIAPNQTKQGTLAETGTGSLYLAMLRFIDDPAATLPMLALLRHPLLKLQNWLSDAEPHFRGIPRHSPGQLPKLPSELRMRPEHKHAARLIEQLASLTRHRQPISQWIATLSELGAEGEGADAVTTAFDALSYADLLGPLDHDDASALITESLSEPWRGGILDAHPDVFFLTPVEARLQQFDRVILANMQDNLWPGPPASSVWLNLTQQQALGLPAPEEQTSLMAHDLLLLGSMGEVFLTWPERDGGSPTARSRFIERLAALLAIHNIDESTLRVEAYENWAHELYHAPYAPSEAPRPTPPAQRRPSRMAVTKLDKLSTDPYALYAYYVLGLGELDPIDKEPEASEFGTLVHGAMANLTRHWNEHRRRAAPGELSQIAETALAPFAANPSAALFWRKRLVSGLEFVNGLEAERRALRAQVKPEETVESAMMFDTQPLTLHGRIDRVEEGADLAIGDYKTGTPPSKKDILEGRAPQLLAYALMLEAAGHKVANLDYWQLPSGRRAGEVVSADFTEEMIAALYEMIGSFLNPQTPLLARPTGRTERFDNPYDGISRYDEWAG